MTASRAAFRRLFVLSVALGLAAWSLAGTACKRKTQTDGSSHAGIARLVTTETSLGAIPAGIEPVSVAVSADGERVACWGPRNRKWIVVIDGQAGEYDEIGGPPADPGTAPPRPEQAPTVVFSPSGRRAAFAARRGRKWVVVADGDEGEAYDEIGTGAPIFPDHGETVFYTARKDTRWFLLADTTRGKAYDWIGRPSLSADGRRVVHWAKRNGQWFLVVDGKEIRKDGLLLTQGCFISRDGRRVACCFLSRSGSTRVAVDGLADREYDEAGPVVFSPDGKRAAYRAKRRSKSLLVVDGAEGEECDAIDAASVRFSPDGKRVAYVAKRGGKQLVVVDGAAGREHWLVVDGPTFSPDGKRVAYRASEGQRRFVVVDGVADAKHDAESGVVFSPDGRRAAYVASREGKQFVVVDGEARGDYESIEKSSLTFSPDSQHVAYWAWRGAKRCVVGDGAEGRPYEQIGKRSVVWSRSPGLVFDGPRSLRALLCVNRDILRVRIEIVEQ